MRRILNSKVGALIRDYHRDLARSGCDLADENAERFDRDSDDSPRFNVNILGTPAGGLA